MASSSKNRLTRNLNKKQKRSNNFRTVVYPDQEKIEIPHDFKAAWYTKLHNQSFASLEHTNGNNVFLGLEVSNVNSFIYGGKCASLLYGIQEPTQVNVKISIVDEGYIVFKFRDFPSDAENDDIFMSDTPNYCLHPYEKDDVFGWRRLSKTPNLKFVISHQKQLQGSSKT